MVLGTDFIDNVNTFSCLGIETEKFEECRLIICWENKQTMKLKYMYIYITTQITIFTSWLHHCYTYQVWKQILVWVLRLWLEQNLEVSVPLLISEEKNITPDSICKSGYRIKGRGLEMNL